MRSTRPRRPDDPRNRPELNRDVSVTDSAAHAPPTPSTPWDRARSLRLVRANPNGHPEPIEPGVNFFLLALERLGAVPQYSCEGHPNGFYIVFRASYPLALRISSCGFFHVSIAGRGLWDLGLPAPQQSQTERDQCLRLACLAWQRQLLDGKPLVP